MLANASTEFGRAQELLKRNFVSRADHDRKLAAQQTAQASLNAARAVVRQRALDLEFTVVRSPIGGQVSDKRVALGDNVIAGQRF